MFNRVTLSVGLLSVAGYAAAITIPRTIYLNADGMGYEINHFGVETPLVGHLAIEPLSGLEAMYFAGAKGGKMGDLILREGSLTGPIEDVLRFENGSTGIWFFSSDHPSYDGDGLKFLKNSMSIIAAPGNGITTYVPATQKVGWISSVALTYKIQDNVPGPAAAVSAIMLGIGSLRRRKRV